VHAAGKSFARKSRAALRRWNADLFLRLSGTSETRVLPSLTPRGTFFLQARGGSIQTKVAPYRTPEIKYKVDRVWL
jgi:hypothetical protein